MPTRNRWIACWLPRIYGERWAALWLDLARYADSQPAGQRNGLKVHRAAQETVRPATICGPKPGCLTHRLIRFWYWVNEREDVGVQRWTGQALNLHLQLLCSITPPARNGENNLTLRGWKTNEDLLW